MSRTYARFAATPIGPLLLAADGGLTLTTAADGTDLQRMAISTVGHTQGIHGAEFSLWGDADLQAAIGVASGAAPLATMVGNSIGGVGWRLDTGQIYANGVMVASGLPAVVKGDSVGVRVVLDGDLQAEFYRGGQLVHVESLTAATWHFAASLAAPEAASLWVYVNAGQQAGGGPAAAAGWRPADPVVPTVRLSDLDWLSDEHHRYEGVIESAGLTTIESIDFWPWGGSSQSMARASVAVSDAGLLDSLAQMEVSGVPVSIRLADPNGAVAGATDVARYALDSIETLDDGRKMLHFRDAHTDLDEPINPGVFLPAIPALAWRTQPLVLGAVASVPVLGANSDGSVGWLADAPLASVASVLDRGDPMEAGTWALASDMQQILLEQPPVGPVVADVSTIGPEQQPASLQQALHIVFSRIEKSAWASADAAAIDAATGYAGVGYYAGDLVAAAQAVDAILPSYGAGRWQDGAGILRTGRVVDPVTVTPTFELTGLELDVDLVMIPDEAPNLSRRMAYRPNARVLAAGELVTDLVDVPVWRRAELTAPWRGQVYSGKPLSPRYAHADTNPPLVSVFWRAEDAQAEIDRVCGLYDRARAFYVATFTDHAFTASPGAVGELTYPRYGLQAGKRVLIRSIERNPMTGKVTLTMWG